ncbi:DapH/DapD/GlmU-related protein [Streptomyces sp. NPDC047082]|uniref:DapH/DapD/GlmU-related protein n=1 Tax=Streptomyces sp. NPDC047082 TaxID=3155259 RepID=UPI0034055C7C
MEHSLTSLSEPLPPEIRDPSALVEAGTEVATGTTVGPGAWIRFGTTVRASVVEGGVFIGFRCRIDSARIVTGCQIASMSRIGRSGAAPVLVEAGAWIGARAVVDPEVRIGPGAVVAAGAHVTADVPADTIVVGRPARVLRRRDVVEDGAPDFTSVLARVRARADFGRKPLPAGWTSDGGGLLDADLSGDPAVHLGAGVVAMGRADGPSPRGGLRIGSDVRVGAGSVLEGSDGIDIGPGTELGARVLVVSSGHDLTRRSLPWQGGPVFVGAGVRVGADATLVGPCALGDGAVVAPGAVVVGDVPAGHTTAGVLAPRQGSRP